MYIMYIFYRLVCVCVICSVVYIRARVQPVRVGMSLTCQVLWDNIF